MKIWKILSFLTNKSLTSSPKLTTCYKRCFRKWTILASLTTEKWKKIMNNQHCHLVMKGASLSILSWDLFPNSEIKFIIFWTNSLTSSYHIFHKYRNGSISNNLAVMRPKCLFSSSSTATGTAQVLLSKCRSNFNKQTFCHLQFCVYEWEKGSWKFPLEPQKYHNWNFHPLQLIA